MSSEPRLRSDEILMQLDPKNSLSSEARVRLDEFLAQLDPQNLRPSESKRVRKYMKTRNAEIEARNAEIEEQLAEMSRESRLKRREKVRHYFCAASASSFVCAKLLRPCTARRDGRVS